MHRFKINTPSTTPSTPFDFYLDSLRSLDIRSGTEVGLRSGTERCEQGRKCNSPEANYTYGLHLKTGPRAEIERPKGVEIVVEGHHLVHLVIHTGRHSIVRSEHPDGKFVATLPIYPPDRLR